MKLTPYAYGNNLNSFSIQEIVVRKKCSVIYIFLSQSKCEYFLWLRKVMLSCKRNVKLPLPTNGSDNHHHQDELAINFFSSWLSPQYFLFSVKGIYSDQILLYTVINFANILEAAFCSKVFCVAFMSLQFGFVWKAACKMSVKCYLVSILSSFYLHLFCTKVFLAAFL